MTAITRRSLVDLVSRQATLASADDLDGLTDGTQDVDVTGARAVFIFQDNVGTAGTLGIDVVQISKDNGTTWAAATDVLALDSDATTGTVLAGGALNAAGVEPTTVATSVFKCGPYEGPTFLRIDRTTNWATGAPKVYCVLVGGKHSGGVPSTRV